MMENAKCSQAKVFEEAREVFVRYLAAHNLRMTTQREIVLNVFLSTARHLSSEELYVLVGKIDGTVGQVTVYRTLKLMAEAGLAREEVFSDGIKRYESVYGEGHHDHLICIQCNTKIEFMDQEIERLQEKIARSCGYVLTGHKMDLYGLCSACRGDNRDASPEQATGEGKTAGINADINA